MANRVIQTKRHYPAVLMRQPEPTSIWNSARWSHFRVSLCSIGMCSIGTPFVPSTTQNIQLQNHVNIVEPFLLPGTN